MTQNEKAERVMIVFTTDVAKEDIGIVMIDGTMYTTMIKELKTLIEENLK